MLFGLLEKFDVLKDIKDGGTFSLNSVFSKDEIFEKMQQRVCDQILDKN